MTARAEPARGGDGAAGRFYEPAREAAARTVEVLLRTDGEVTAFARSRPLTAAAIALAAGYAVGRALSRWG